MNEEIKEILDELKHYSYGYDSYDEEKYKINKLLDYITNLQQRIYKARKMIFDNYGVLDKYEIEMLDDILKGGSDE